MLKVYNKIFWEECSWKVLSLVFYSMLISGHTVLTTRHNVNVISSLIKLKRSPSMKQLFLCITQFGDLSVKNVLANCSIHYLPGWLIHTWNWNHHLISSKTCHIMHHLQFPLIHPITTSLLYAFLSLFAKKIRHLTCKFIKTGVTGLMGP